MRIAVIDYDAGNLRSVETALRHIEADFFVTADAEKVRDADGLIFPGVGDAGASMQVLVGRGLDTALKEHAASGKPFLGICLGSQIVLDRSAEADAELLGIVPGEAPGFPLNAGEKVPHIGWNTVRHDGTGIFAGVPQDASFYFVHSYYPRPSDASATIGTCHYILDFCAALQHDNVIATQFHPEKSGTCGLQMLRNFSRGI